MRAAGKHTHNMAYKAPLPFDSNCSATSSKLEGVVTVRYNIGILTLDVNNA
jgi:hypothetical protein